MRRNRQRPTVDLPQPDSPTRPSVSPANMSNETPSTARTTSSVPSTGKCFTKPRTLTSVSTSGATSRTSCLRLCSSIISYKTWVNLFTFKQLDPQIDDLPLLPPPDRKAHSEP